jgi:hypothetical protein
MPQSGRDPAIPNFYIGGRERHRVRVKVREVNSPLKKSSP